MFFGLLLFSLQAFSATDILDQTFNTTVDGLAVPVDYHIRTPHQKKFDPSKPTVVFISGGPRSVAVGFREVGPAIPEDLQVIKVDYLGTRRDDKGFPNISDDAVLKNFNQTTQARTIKDVIKRLGLKKYVIWGESLGVSVSLRTLDAIQRDNKVKTKPRAAWLDSGGGRPVTQADMAWMNKCYANKPGTPEKCEPPSPQREEALKAYIKNCYSKPITQEQTSFVYQHISWPGIKDDLKPYLEFFGCPPIQKLDYTVWEFAMACGEFEPQVAQDNLGYCSSKCHYPICGEVQEQCKKNCSVMPKCLDTPTQVKDYKLGRIPIVGLQARDDCSSWPETMDYLMKNLDPDRSEYVTVERGGHVSYDMRDVHLWDDCHKESGPLFNDLFEGRVHEVGQRLRLCYKAPPSADNAGLESAQ